MSNLKFALLYIGCIRNNLVGVELSYQLLVRLMHTNQQTAMSEHLLVVLIDILSRNLIYLIDNQIPATQVKVAYAEIHTLDTVICDEVLQALHKLRLDIVVNPCHVCTISFRSIALIGIYRYTTNKQTRKKRGPLIRVRGGEIPVRLDK